MTSTPAANSFRLSTGQQELFADSGDSGSSKTNPLAGLLPVELTQALSNLMKATAGSASAWRSYLDQMTAEHGAQICFTTFKNEQPSDFSSLLSRFQKAGDGGLRVTESDGTEMFTIANQNITLTISDLPPARNYLVHLLAYFPANVENNFYVSFETESGRDSVRFGNAYISICDDASTLECDTKTLRLYTFAVGEGFVSLFVNGVLQKRKSRRKPQSFVRFVLRLVGAQNADLGAVIKGMEIWTLERHFAGFNRNSRDLVLRRLEELIEAGDSEGIHDWVISYDDIDLAPFRRRILAVLETNLTGPGVKEWIYEDVSKRIAPEVEPASQHTFAIKLPAPVITVEDLSVRFHRFPNKRLSISRILGFRKSETFDVLRGITFRAYPGDILGVIGANGAGKSTLLKALAGLIPIQEGKITLRGHHLLLSPGLGMRNELSGRENIYLAGCFMGLSLKQIERLYNDIVEFSELQEFIDQPFKFYSDGMKSRLIFSIATSVAPNILMLDELLNAGDIKFQVKAAHRLDELITRAKIVIVVTHSIQFVADKCNKALLLSHGKQIYYGSPDAAIAHYLDELHMSLNRTEVPEKTLADAQQIQI